MSLRIEINPKYKALEGFVREVAENGLPHDLHIIYDRRNRLGWVERDGLKINIKRFHVPKFPNHIVYVTLRKSKAYRSFHNGMELQRLGFGTPEPIAYVEHRTPWLAESYYFSLQVDLPTIRHKETTAEGPAIIAALGREMSRLHSKGVHIRDFSPGNILYGKDKDGEYQFQYVDLNRITFGQRDHKQLMSMFKAIFWCPEDIAKLAAHYAMATDGEFDRASVEAMEAYARYHRRVARHQQWKILRRRYLGKKYKL